MGAHILNLIVRDNIIHACRTFVVKEHVMEPKKV